MDQAMQEIQSGKRHPDRELIARFIRCRLQHNEDPSVISEHLRSCIECAHTAANVEIPDPAKRKAAFEEALTYAIGVISGEHAPSLDQSQLHMATLEELREELRSRPPSRF